MMTILVIVAVLLVAATGFQILKVSELVSVSKGEKVYEVTEKQSKAQGLMFLIFMVAYFGFFVWILHCFGFLLNMRIVQTEKLNISHIVTN
jgi:hypothetical protein